MLGITKEVVEVLRQYHWPGNVRELCNVIQRAIAMGSSDFIGPQDLPAVLACPSPKPGTRSKGLILLSHDCKVV